MARDTSGRTITSALVQDADGLWHVADEMKQPKRVTRDAFSIDALPAAKVEDEEKNVE